MKIGAIFTVCWVKLLVTPTWCIDTPILNITELSKFYWTKKLEFSHTLGNIEPNQFLSLAANKCNGIGFQMYVWNNNFIWKKKNKNNWAIIDILLNSYVLKQKYREKLPIYNNSLLCCLPSKLMVWKPVVTGWGGVSLGRHVLLSSSISFFYSRMKTWGMVHGTLLRPQRVGLAGTGRSNMLNILWDDLHNQIESFSKVSVNQKFLVQYNTISSQKCRFIKEKIGTSKRLFRQITESRGNSELFQHQFKDLIELLNCTPWILNQTGSDEAVLVELK